MKKILFVMMAVCFAGSLALAEDAVKSSDTVAAPAAMSTDMSTSTVAAPATAPTMMSTSDESTTMSGTTTTTDTTQDKTMTKDMGSKTAKTAQ